MTAEFDRTAVSTALAALEAYRVEIGHRRIVDLFADDPARAQTIPAQLGDLLALMGDASDNVPGVPGVGPKGAAKLLADYAARAF